MIESGNRRASTLAAVALAAMAASPSVHAERDLGYPIPTRWSPNKRSGNNRRVDSAKRHAKEKMAKKSRQQQRKRAKGK